MIARRTLAAVTGAALATYGAVRYRRWHLSWGAADEELQQALPGDDMCPRPNFAFTRAITIEAKPEHIWPWLVQIGFRRAGWYSYDLLDNLGRPSAEQIIPELQHLEIGNLVSMGGKGNEVTAMRVKDFRINEWLLWEHLGDQWVWVLHPIDDNVTRVITRGRQRYHWTSPMLISELVLMEIADFFMMRKLLLNLKQRAERPGREQQEMLPQQPSEGALAR